MRFSTSFLLPLSALFMAVMAQTNTTGYQVRCLRFPRPAIGNATFAPEAIGALSQALADNSFNPALPADGIKLSAGSASRVGWGGDGKYQICLQNFYLFKTLTVPLKTISEAVAEIKDTCCVAEAPTTPSKSGRVGLCQDARAVIQIDGSNVDVVAQDYGDNCCGMWGC